MDVLIIRLEGFRRERKLGKRHDVLSLGQGRIVVRIPPPGAATVRERSITPSRFSGLDHLLGHAAYDDVRLKRRISKSTRRILTSRS